MTEFPGRFRARIEAQLDLFLSDSNVPIELLSAMRYAVFNGGKRIRPTLTYLSAQALGKDISLVDATACAIELIHAYSLVHDDLPSMDDDELRRGQPTCHIKFGEALAILAGDALQARAFEIIATDSTMPAVRRLNVIATLSRAAGAAGMVAGQVLDLAFEDKTIAATDLETMHRRKTGDLISASVVCSAIAVGASETEVAALERFGYDLGLAFQVKDDILDETGDTAVMGKSAGSDRAKRKATFVSLHGVNQATAILHDLRKDATLALSTFGDAAKDLIAMAEFVTSRDH